MFAILENTKDMLDIALFEVDMIWWIYSCLIKKKH